MNIGSVDLVFGLHLGNNSIYIDSNPQNWVIHNNFAIILDYIFIFGEKGTKI